MQQLSCTLMLLFATLIATAQAAQGPPVPYYDRGACPFECCTYREWTTNGPVTLHADVGTTKTVVARLKRGEQVVGITGVVITTRPGRVKVLRSLTLDTGNPVSASAGDILYTLHRLGEGFDLFWFKGRLHEHQLAADEVQPKPSPGADWHILAVPRTEWWVKVKTANGKVGWTKETQRFDHMDACE